MQKKLMAIAVAGALGAPAVVMAQASTVQIYGKITYEYAHIDQGQGRPSTDYADTPGGSAIGFKGEEKLGGNLSAWFQCESSVDVRGLDGSATPASGDGTPGWCTRNSAVGFKGNWGNLHFGRWDTPMKRSMAPGSVGAIGETGALGTSFVAWGGSGGTNATVASNRVRWKRREVGLTYYESPNMGGFQVLAAFSPGNGAIDNGAVDGDSNTKPRVWSFGGIYKAGPLGIGVGYEKHTSFRAAPTAPPTPDFDDRAWSLAAGYQFGPVELGATYLDAKYDTGVGATTKRKSWTVGVEWQISGPHSLRAFYGHAGDSSGNGAGIGGGASGSIPAPQIGGVPTSDTGAKDWSIGYGYQFSKRTLLQIGYHKTDNDTNAFYKNGNANTPLVAGDSQSAYGFHITHNF